MTNNIEVIGRCRRIPVLTDPHPDELEIKLKYTQRLLKIAHDEEAEKAKAVLDSVAKLVKKEEKQSKRKYKVKKISEFKTLSEICPDIFDELIQRNKSDYMNIISEKLFPYITRKLERDISRFIFSRTLAFNKTVEKIKYSEFINGTWTNTGELITQGIGYSFTSVYEGIKLGLKRKTFFVHQFSEGDYYWFFLNTSENRKLLDEIKAGNINQKEMFRLNKQKVKSLRKSKFSEGVSFGKCNTPIKNLNTPDSDDKAESIDNTSISNTPIITNNNIKEKQNQKNNTYSEKEEEYIQKLIGVKNPEGENIKFSLSQAREIVKLDLGRSIFDIIDEKIEMLFMENNPNKKNWASILNNMIKEDRGGIQAYIEFKGKRESLITHEKYILLVKIFEPEANFNCIDKNKAVKIIQDKILTLYEIAIKNKNIKVKEELLSKLERLQKSCDIEKDLGFHILDSDSMLYQILEELKKLI